MLARSRRDSRAMTTWIGERETVGDFTGFRFRGHGCFLVLYSPEPGSRPTGTSPGSSLMTLRHMVASGLGMTLIPASAEPLLVDDEVLVKPLKPSPGRRMVLASRHRFPRRRALAELTRALQALQLPGTEPVAR